MTAERQRTCEERIEENLESRLAFMKGVLTSYRDPVTEDGLADTPYEDLAEMVKERHTELPWKRGKDGRYRTARSRADLIEALVEQSDRADDEWVESPISVSTETVVTVQFSWGGPSDEFKVTLDDDGDITNVEYLFKDWFDGAKRGLVGEQEEVASDFLGRFTELVMDH
jgi:hypothetical protein